MKVVIAPDKFKGTLTAAEAALAVHAGVERALPTASIVSNPMADGGEGTMQCLLEARGGELREQRVSGPLGKAVRAGWVLLSDGTAVVEMASASGLRLTTPSPSTALSASSRGTGELVASALAARPRSVLVGVGGSASTDGGAGAATAAGWRFLDASSAPLPEGGGGLRDLAVLLRSPERIETPVVAACDVSSPLHGDDGAARMFGPQKGAGPEEVEILEAGLRRLADVSASQLGLELDRSPGAGAGGGMGAGLEAFFGASLESGAALVASACGLAEKMRGADLVITGEGKLDEQSLRGKAVAEVARLASELGVPCIAIAGQVDETVGGLGLAAVKSLVDEHGEEARRDPFNALAHTSEQLVKGV